MPSAITYFSQLPDPRIDRSKDHLLEDIIFITISAVICGAETWNDIENYGKSKEAWLREYLQLPNGIPSHDTFNRFFSALNPDEFEKAFIEWIKDISELSNTRLLIVYSLKRCNPQIPFLWIGNYVRS